MAECFFTFSQNSEEELRLEAAKSPKDEEKVKVHARHGGSPKSLSNLGGGGRFGERGGRYSGVTIYILT